MSSPSVVQAFRASLWNAGYRPVAVKTGTKVPLGSAWTDRARLTPPEAATAWPEQAALSTGVLCDGLRVIDVDVDDPGAAYQVQQCAVQLLGRAPIRTRPDSPRFALVYRTSEDTPKKRTKDGKLGRIEALTNGGQFVVDGLHADTGKPYEWPSGDLRAWPLQSLTIVTPHGLTAFLEAATQIIGSAPARESPPVVPASDAPQVVTDRERAYAKQALDAEVVKLIAMGEGSGRNNAINVAAHSLGTMVGAGWIDGKIAAYALLEAATTNGYVAKRGELAARKTIESGLSSGLNKPRAPLADSSMVPVDVSKLTVKGKAIKPDAAPIRAKRTVKLIRGSEIVEEALTWLWDGYLPAGKLTLLAGAGGTGKSTLAFNLAAIVTNGGAWPDGTRCATPGNVLIWSSEDDPADTIKPRLMAAQADESRYGVIAGSVDENGIVASFDPANDIGNLYEAVQAIGGVKLLIIDPIVSAVSGDMNKSNDVRRGLQAVVDFAAEMDCAVIGITHFAKNTEGRNTSDRVLGSAAFSAFARMVLATAKEEDSDSRVLTRAKSNNSRDTGGFRYSIEAIALHRGITATRVVWGEAVDGTSREILAIVEHDDRTDSKSQMGAAQTFLRNALVNGPMSAKQLIQEARDGHGISEKTLRRAQKELGILAEKSAGTMVGQWQWRFPFLPSGFLSAAR